MPHPTKGPRIPKNTGQLAGFVEQSKKTDLSPQANLRRKEGGAMFHISPSRLHRIIGVGFLIGMSIDCAPYAHAQDANAASVAELQQRVADLEAVVRQLRDARDPAAAPTAMAPSPAGNPAGPIAPSAAPAAAPAANANAEFVQAAPIAPVGGDAIPYYGGFAGWNDGFYMWSADKSFLLRITGQIQSDFRGYLQDVQLVHDRESARGGQSSHRQSGYVPHPSRAPRHRGNDAGLLRVSTVAGLRRKSDG